ncbi:hypothetical protein LTR53_016712 [Teratosphaeriaceae sp. CCFEE 6253]|nr:hypothetical protein LTR53_016712 [Teratosphaeriaceae sp. CCFEE 6253]
MVHETLAERSYIFFGASTLSVFNSCIAKLAQPMRLRDWQVLKHSPVFCAAITNIWSTWLANRQANQKQGKTIVFYQSAKVGEWLHKVLGFLGIGSAILWSGLNVGKRYEKICRFNDLENPDIVMLVPFTLRMEGVNMHTACSNIICLDPPANDAVLEQAIGRIRRPGQKAEQHITRLHLTPTWASVRDLRYFEKALNKELVINAYSRTLMGGAAQQLAVTTTLNAMGLVAGKEVTATQRAGR